MGPTPDHSGGFGRRHGRSLLTRGQTAAPAEKPPPEPEEIDPSKVIATLRLDDPTEPQPHPQPGTPTAMAPAGADGGNLGAGGDWDPAIAEWYYQDDGGNLQGPFKATAMQDWFDQMFFQPSLLLRRAEETALRPLSEHMEIIGDRRQPFLVPPITKDPVSSPDALPGGIPDWLSQGATQGLPAAGPLAALFPGPSQMPINPVALQGLQANPSRSLEDHLRAEQELLALQQFSHVLPQHPFLQPQPFSPGGQPQPSFSGGQWSGWPAPSVPSVPLTGSVPNAQGFPVGQDFIQPEWPGPVPNVPNPVWAPELFPSPSTPNPIGTPRRAHSPPAIPQAQAQPHPQPQLQPQPSAAAPPAAFSDLQPQQAPLASPAANPAQPLAHSPVATSSPATALPPTPAPDQTPAPVPAPVSASAPVPTEKPPSSQGPAPAAPAPILAPAPAPTPSTAPALPSAPAPATVSPPSTAATASKPAPASVPTPALASVEDEESLQPVVKRGKKSAPADPAATAAVAAANAAKSVHLSGNLSVLTEEEFKRITRGTSPTESVEETVSPATSLPAKPAPWAEKGASSGPSLREIQAAELKAAEARKKTSNPGVASRIRPTAPAAGPSLPILNRSWGLASAPAPVAETPRTAAWTTAGGKGKKPTLSEIQEEEKKTQATQVQGARTLPPPPKPAVTAAIPAAPAAGWAVVGAQGKPASAAKKIPAPRVPIPAKPMARRAPTAASPEFIAHLKEQLRGGLHSARLDDFIEVLLSFPVDATPETMEIIAETVYASSSTLDGRRFAADFVAKRKMDLAQPLPPPTTHNKKASNYAGPPLGATAGLVGRTGPDLSRIPVVRPTADTFGGFKVVKGKGGKKK